MLIPSVELLRDTFRRAVKQALGKCEETHSGHYRSRCSSLAGAPWVQLGPNVQAIQRSESEFLVRASWQFTIDQSTKDQLKIAQSEIQEIASRLAAVIPTGEAVKGTFEFPSTETFANGERLTCSFKGVARGRVLCTAVA